MQQMNVTDCFYSLDDTMEQRVCSLIFPNKSSESLFSYSSAFAAIDENRFDNAG
jgi:hypothetical protein